MVARLAASAATVLLAVLALAGAVSGRSSIDVRVTVFGDSAATAMAYDPDAKRVLGRGIDLKLEIAACRRIGDASCPYDGVRPPNVIDRATDLGRELGSVVVVIVGYNDYEASYGQNIEDALAAFRKAGVERVLWSTLRAERQSYVTMNETIAAIARKHPELTVLDWNAVSRENPAWLQPDGIHLTPAGANGMAAMVNDALVRLGAAPPATPTPKPAVKAKRKFLAITSQALPVARTGRLYSVRLHATGGTSPYRWMRTGGILVPGLRLTVDGRLAGRATRPGTFKLRLRVVDRAGAARARILSLRIV
jgi:hypothetical protein